jgi:hypothetical protein
MVRMLVMIGAAFLVTSQSLAQPAPSPTDCEQIRQAVATYGYVAARKYAVVHYGVQAAKYGDRCLNIKHK